MTRKQPTAEERAEQLRQQLIADFGAQVPELERRLNDLDNAYVDVMGDSLKSRLRPIGDFLNDYGAGHIWHDLYFRFGLDVTDSEEAWAIDERYKPGDEWRFVFKGDEAKVREAMERTRS